VPDPSVDCPVVDYGTDGLLLALEGSSTADDESISAFFQKDAVYALMNRILPVGFNPDDGFTVPAEDVATALIDGGLGTVVYAPDPRTYPDLQRLNNPLQPADQSSAWLNVNPNESIKRPVTNPLGGARANVDPNAPTPGQGGGSGGGPGGGSGGGSGGGCGCGCGGRGSHTPCGCGCGCGGGGGPCGCGCDEGEEKDPEVLAHEARMMKLQAERDAELRRLDTERMMLDSADRVNQAKAWNQLLDHRVQAAEKAAAEGREHPKPVGKKGKKGRGCRGDCDQGGGMKSQVAVIIGQLIVLMEQQREAQREASEARLAFGRADGAHLALVARLEKVSGAARSRQQPAVDAALVVRNDAQAEMERWEAKAQDLQTQVETLHIRLREAVVPPVPSQDEPGEPAPPAPVTESDTQKER
jgi:hypothetical protein